VVKKQSYEELEQRVKELEAALRDSEPERTTIIDLQPYHSVIQSLDNRIIWANRAAFESVGMSREELIGRYCYEIWPKQTSPCSDCPVIKSVQTGKPQSIEKTTPDGKKWHIRAYPLSNKRGQIARVFQVTEEITERKQIEEALRKSEEQYRNIFKNIQDVYYEVTLDGIILEASPSIKDFSLYKREEIIGKSLYDIYVDPKERAEFLKELMKNGKVTDYETLLLDKDGSHVPCSITAKLLFDKQDNPVKIIGSLRDITQRKRMEESLRQSESQKRAILDASIDRIRHVDEDMKIIWGNKACVNASGMAQKDMIGKTCYQLFTGRNKPCPGCSTLTSKKTGRIEKAIMYQPKARGISGKSYWEAYAVPLKNEAGRPLSFIQITRNITEQVLAEEQIHTLTHQLMKAQESERQMISRELHDCVAQQLAVAKINCELLLNHYPEINSEIRQKISETQITLQESIQAVRDLSYDLRPPALDEMGLVEMLVHYCHDFSKENEITVDFHSAGMEALQLDFDTEINLYRLIQEGLTNIKKHADADQVTIKLVATFPNIILRIEDNGKGFNVEERMATLTKEKRMGIHSMMQRAKLLHGEMEIQSKPVHGTKICIRFPYKDNNSGPEENNINSRRSTP
jgi:PAS domain S-box-containing protein